MSKSPKHEEMSAAPAPEPAPAAPAAPPERSELDRLKDQLLRLQADFDNFRKRTARERAELGLRANEDLIKALLPVLDHFELGLKSAAEHQVDAAVQDGFQMVLNDLLAALKSCGVTPLDAHSAGFDPHQHEAVAHVPSDEYPADQIVAQTRRGYRLGDRLLRPVQVVVSSGPGAPRDDGMEQGAAPAEGSV